MNTLVTVITPTTGSPLLKAALESVARQNYPNVQHLVVIDGKERAKDARRLLRNRPVDIIELPYPTGADGHLGHRIYGGATYVAKGDFICFLDEDNWMDEDHIESLVRLIQNGHDWAYSLRKIVDTKGEFVCFDNCESLGKWPSIISDDDFFIDVNCFMLSKEWALRASPIWYRRCDEPDGIQVDRMLSMVLRQDAPHFECNYQYTLNYRAGSTERSVKPDFFIKGNKAMAERYNGKLPWSPWERILQPL